MFLNNGSVKIKIEPQPGKRSAYTVITPLYQVRAKGTEFTVSVDENGDSKVETLSGTVEILDLENNKIDQLEGGESYKQEYSINEKFNSNLLFLGGGILLVLLVITTIAIWVKLKK